MTGRTISHYRVQEELGRGGMGVVYRARDERLRRDVALKLLLAETAGLAQSRTRILAEARAASALNHPGITTIYEIGEEGEQLFIVMELVSGRPLRALIAQGPMDPLSLARLGALAAAALGAAHERGIIHGDVKPENIMVQPDGRVKLLDFGIARQLTAETATMTRRGLEQSGPPGAQIAGTIAYMAPEQFLGAETDARADLFSLGVVLYEMAAGHRPFPGPSATALMAQILNDPAPALRGPSALAGVLNRLLEKKPESRCQSARELAADLGALARDLELGKPLPGAPSKRAVAVLPFKLLTPNPQDEYLCVALADALINQLGAGGELLVRPTSTVMRYAQPGVDPLQAARELNVQVLVDGSIQKIGQRLRVHVQAWDAAEGATLASAKYDSEMVDLFGLQDQIAEGLERALGAKAGAPVAASAAPPTKNPKAYELFLRGADRLSRLNRWDTRTAIEMFENATAIDPRFADAWARLAEACVQMGAVFEPGPQWFRQAERAVRRALVIDPENAEAQVARGRILWTAVKRFQNLAALRALHKALRLNPGSLEARKWLGGILLHVGLLDEAREVLIAALAVNPEDAFTLTFLGQTALYSGELEKADDYYARALAVDPAHLWANLFYPTILLYRRQQERAAEKIRTANVVAPSEATLLSCEAQLWLQRGRNRKAAQIVQRALRGPQPLLHLHHLLHNAAVVYAQLGKPAQAVGLLRKAGGLGLPNYPAFRDDPFLEPLHDHPQFLRLLADLKREWNGYRKELTRRW